MVKVFTSNFSFFDGQDIVTPSKEPLAISCSKECLFVAMEGCLLEVYQLDSRKLIGQFLTISPVVQFVYNPVGDCIVTMERKPQETARGFARVYCKWRGSSVDKPMRVSLLESVPVTAGNGGFSRPQPQGRIAAEIVELPAEMGSSVTCVACCEKTGRIAVGIGTMVRVFGMDMEGGGGGEGEAVVSHNIEILVDIMTGISVRKIAIFGDFVAFVSSYEARVVKLLFCSDVKSSLRNYRVEKEEGVEEEEEEGEGEGEGGSESALDPSFIRWSPSLAWEADYTTKLDTGHETSCDSKPRPPTMGFVTLPSVLSAAQKKRRRSKSMPPKEVLGPVEYIWGHPLTLDVSIPSHGDTPGCRALTMLYHRFPRNGGGQGRMSRSATLPVRGGSQGGWGEEEEEGGIHSVQLVPTIVEGTL